MVCWVPLVILSLVYGNFWTGDFHDSFITSLEAQTRFLVALPILILVEPLISARLKKTLLQFHDGGLIPSHRVEEFWDLVKRKVDFLQNRWTYIIIVVICYIQVAIVFNLDEKDSSLAAWQLQMVSGEIHLNMAGKWAVLVSRPLTMFFIYRWILRVFLWGRILAKISNLDLKLSPFHADRVGGLGFLPFSISYFTPFAFSISTVIAGLAADLVLAEKLTLVDYRIPLLVYVALVTIFFTYPLFAFSDKLVSLKERSIFSIYDQIKFVYQKAEFPPSLGANSKPMEDEKIAYISSLSDFNAMMANVLNLRAMVFQVRDIVPLWVVTLLPFFFVILIKIPLEDIISRVFSALF